eukprot:gene26344-34978_t
MPAIKSKIPVRVKNSYNPAATGTVFSIFQECKISVDVVASSDDQLRSISEVIVLEDRAIVSLISNLERSSEVMAIAFQVMQELGITVEMLSQGASKVNISLVVKMKDKDRLIQALHARFFET